MTTSRNGSIPVLAIFVVPLLVLSIGGYAGFRILFPEARANQDALADWTHVVSPGLEDLDSVPSVPGMISDGPGTVGECSFDDLELFQPSATKSWSLVNSSPDKPADFLQPAPLLVTQGIDRIASHLESLGWELVEAETSQFHTTQLRSAASEYGLSISIQGFGESILATVYYPDSPTVCHRKW